ncbi:MAG: metal-dependent hydrolase [Sphingobacteriales bacterium]|nr:MAG: metal-dependent hydrolase [Sphingobacteriales bacterium]
MDSITQFTLGAAIGEAVLGKKIGNKAVLWGGFAGTIPDLDVMFSPLLDNVQRLGFHRGYSHSLLFALIVGPILGWLFWKWYKNHPAQTTLQDWVKLFLLGIITHPILDSFTTYGTQLFLPFSDYRVGLNNIFIVDPIYTIPFLLLLILAMFFNRTNPLRRKLNYAGLIISSVYMLFTLGTKVYVDRIFANSLHEQKIDYQRFMSATTPLNSILWYAVVEVDRGYYMGYYSLFDKDRHIHYDFIARNDSLLSGIQDSYAVDRVKWFSNGYYAVRPHNNPDEVRFYDLKFGKMGFEGSTEKFIFAFNLKKLPDGNVVMHQSRDDNGRDFKMGDAFRELWQRIMGIKPI